MGLIINSGFTIGPGVVLDAGYTPLPSFITAGLQLYLDAGNPTSYTFPSSSWTDLINGKVFTLYNGPNYYSDYGGYLNFSTGSSQYAEATSLPNSLSNWTVEAWHYYDGTNSSGSPCIITESYAGTPINYTLGNCTDSSPNVQVGHWDGSSFNATPQGHVLTAGHWYHVVGTYDGTAHRLYINGTLTAIQATTSPAQRGGVGIRLMCRWDYGQYWGGALAIVRIYNAALGDAGVLQNYAAERARFGI
jgi:hypothetical protein